MRMIQSNNSILIEKMHYKVKQNNVKQVDEKHYRVALPPFYPFKITHSSVQLS